MDLTCDPTNQIVVGAGFITSMKVDGTIDSAQGFYVFDKTSLITTSFSDCFIESYAISPSSTDVQIVTESCSTNPCRDIKIVNHNVITTPAKYDFKVLITAHGGATMTVDQSVEVVCSPTSTIISKSSSMITHKQSAPGQPAFLDLSGISSS
jgi:hypothetical protein